MPTRHIILCTVRADVSADAVRQAFAPLAALRGQIPGILAFSSGFGTLPHGHSQGYNYGIVMDFADAAARDAYLHDPRHAEAVAATLPVREPESHILAFDYDYT